MGRNNVKLTTAEFIDRAKAINGEKYDYSEVNYITTKHKVTISCNTCGYRWAQLAGCHLRGRGCDKCAISERRMNLRIGTEKFIERSIAAHGDAYDYGKVDYTGGDLPVIIGCKTCGKDFMQSPSVHVKKHGCPHCGGRTPVSMAEFLRRCKAKWGDSAYDYSEVTLSNMKERIRIKCNTCGHKFERSASHHSREKSTSGGCPLCLYPQYSGELAIESILIGNEITFEKQKYFSGLGQRRFDFYLPDQKACIEYDGEQHFMPVKFFGGQARYEAQKKRDAAKADFCEQNGIKLIRIPYTIPADRIEEEIVRKLGIDFASQYMGS